MTPVRTVARALLAAVFVRGGLSAYNNPDRLVDGAKPVTDKLAPTLDALGLPTDTRTLVKFNGAVQVAGGILLATNTAVKPAALALAASLVPTTVAGHDFWTLDDPGQRAGHQIHFLKNLGLLGGLLLAAVDTEGKPGLAWRTGHLAGHAQDSVKRAAHSTARETKRAAHSTARETKAGGEHDGPRDAARGAPHREGGPAGEGRDAARDAPRGVPDREGSPARGQGRQAHRADRRPRDQARHEVGEGGQPAVHLIHSSLTGLVHGDYGHRGEVGSRMEFRILGPLDITGVRLRGLLHQRILAALILDANRPVSLSRLAEAAWGDDPPTTARRQVQNRIADIRSALTAAGAATALTTTAHGYRLTVAPTAVDVAEFERLASSDDPALLRDALALWRGPALADLGSPYLERAATALEEKRLATLERCVDLELATGRHHEVLAELTALVDAYPLRERPVGLLMTALYRAGRQSDALNVYRELAGRLADELGVDPGTELRELHRQVLRGELAGPVRPTCSHLPRAIADFTGRRPVSRRPAVRRPARPQRTRSGRAGGGGPHAG